MQKRFGIMRYILFIAFAAVFIYSAVALATDYAETRESADAFTALSKRLARAEARVGTSNTLQVFTRPEGENAGTGTQADGVSKDDQAALATEPQSEITTMNIEAPLPAQAPVEVPAEVSYDRALDKFMELYEENPELGGWVTIPGTVIDYPVMFTPNNPEKYLRRGFNGKESANGTPFIGKGGTIAPQSDNIVLYGHHMKSGAMFAGIVKYEQKAYWQEHPVIQFSTLYEEGEYEIFAAFKTDIYRARSLRCYNFTNAEDEADFDEFIADIRRVALYDTGIEVSYGDKLLALSTCNYHTRDGRFVIMARKR